MNDRPIVIAEYQHVLEAHVARSKLEAMGLSAHVADENARRSLAGATSVRLIVREADAEQAASILFGDPDDQAAGPFGDPDDQAAEVFGDADDDDLEAGDPLPDVAERLSCPACGSMRLRRQGLMNRLSHMASWLFTTPENDVEAAWECIECAYQWDNR